MSNPRPFKRRRLDDALHKPFRSPLRTPLAPKSASQSNAQSTLSASSLSPHKPLSCSTQSKIPSISPSPATTPVSNKGLSKPTFKSRHQQFQATCRATETAILQTRREIDSLKQALQLLQDPGKDDELRSLIVKWRGAARMAAEDVFGTARDRVNRMGGVAAWRASEREREEERRLEWEAEMQKAMQKDGVDVYERTIDEDHEEREGEEKAWNLREDDGFTMDMMLTSMNIDLAVIGYCTESKTWI